MGFVDNKKNTDYHRPYTLTLPVVQQLTSSYDLKKSRTTAPARLSVTFPGKQKKTFYCFMMQTRQPYGYLYQYRVVSGPLAELKQSENHMCLSPSQSGTFGT